MQDSINLKDSLQNKKSARQHNSTMRNSKNKNFEKLTIERPNKQMNLNSPASVNDQALSKVGSHIKTKSEIVKPKDLGTITLEKLNITSSRKHFKKTSIMGASIYTKTNIKSAKSSALENNIFNGNQDSVEGTNENLTSHLKMKRHSMEQEPDSINTPKLTYYNDEGT